MANKSKYTDRCPKIRSAGKVSEPNDTVGDSLKMYSQEEAAENVMQLKCEKEIQKIQETGSLRFSPFLPIETLKDLLCPELKKSRFVAFKEKFSEDMFFKKPELGKAFPTQSKPEDYNNENFTYGIKRSKSEKAYELVLPQETAEQVNGEYINWHEKYIISHNHYFPSEKIKRNYNDKFNSNGTFGKCNKVDKTGQMVKACLQQCDRLVVVNKTQKMFLDRTSGCLGQRNNSHDLNLDPMTTFGIVTNRPDCDVRTLIENVQPCEKKTMQIEAISHINKLRRFLFNRADFHMYDLKSLLQKYDKENTGYITYNSIFKALRSLLIYVSEEKIRTAASHFGIVINEDQPTECVDLDAFWKMLHIQYPLPRKGVISKMPKNVYNKDTTYRVLCKDLDKPLIYDNFLERIHKPTDADRTTAGDVISPDIPMHFGLGPSDFETLRNKDDLRRIFKRLLVDNNFDDIWEFARDNLNGDDNCKMSVNNLRAAMDIYNNRNWK